MRSRCGYDAVEQHLECKDIRRRGAAVSRIVDLIASNCYAHSIWVLLLGPVIANNPGVSYITPPILWDFVSRDEIESVCDLNYAI